MDVLVPETTLISVHPGTGERLAEVRSDSASEVKAKVACAREALDGWRATPLPQRLALIRSLHARLAHETQQIAQTLSAEIGRPLQESIGAEVIPTLRGLEALCRHAPTLLQPIICGGEGRHRRSRSLMAWSESSGPGTTLSF